MSTVVPFKTQSEKPIPKQNLENIVAALTPLVALARWVTWTYVWIADKWTKEPYSRGGRRKWGHPQSWMTHAQALAQMQAKGHDGIGLVLSPECEIVGIDLDKCICYENGRRIVSPWAASILEKAEAKGAYTEVTVSDTGARIIGRTTRKVSIHCKIKGEELSDGVLRVVSGATTGPGFEIYCRPTNQYITVSGRDGEGNPLTSIDEFVDEILQRYPQPVKPVASAPTDRHWRLDPSRGCTPFEQLDANLRRKIVGPLPTKIDESGKSELFWGVVENLILENWSATETYELLKDKTSGCARRYIEEGRTRLPDQINKRFDEFRAEWEARAAEAAQRLNLGTGGQQAQLSQTVERPPTLGAEQSATANVPAPPPPERGSWRAKALRNGKQFASNVANAQLAISTDFAGCFACDEMSHETVVCTGEGRVRLTDEHVIEIQMYLQRQGLLRVGKEAVHDAIAAEARRHSFHPIREYLNGLAWDDVERLPTWLSTYLGAPQNDYTAAIGMMFPISAVARIMRPGCQADYTLVLEGGQGELKSSACRVLAGDAHFLDHLPPLKNKDSSQILRGRWLVECAEMVAFSEAKIRDTKEFITRRTEIYFARYGRVESKEPRQCVIIISTNESIYLYDPTGNRRYWPVLIGTIDLAALKRDRDQLWAEAKARYDKGEHWWPSREFERKHIQPEQEAREAPPDPWEEPIATFIHAGIRQSNGTVIYRDRFTIGQVLDGAGYSPAGGGKNGLKDIAQRTRLDSDRVARILLKLGCKRAADEDGKPIKVHGQVLWTRPAPPRGR